MYRVFNDESISISFDKYVDFNLMRNNAWFVFEYLIEQVLQQQ